MKNISFIALLLLSHVAIAQQNSFRPTITAAANRIEEKVIEWRHDIHQNPELGNREVRTAALVAKHLQSLGIEVKTNFAKTGVMGILKNGKPGPVVALRADTDALPVTEKTSVRFCVKSSNALRRTGDWRNACLRT